MEDLVVKYEADKADNETKLTGLDNSMKEVSGYTESKQLDSVERILELRKEFVDKHAEYLEMSNKNR